MENNPYDYWIETYSGKKFYVLRPWESQIDIRDIAHALSLVCRFAGHCSEFYSVAEHSVRVSGLVSKQTALAALLHDAAEAYIGDTPRPIKTEEEKLLEDIIQKEILANFDVIHFDEEEVKKADMILLATEARDLMDNIQDWYLPEPVLVKRIIPWSSRVAEREFLQRFHKLGGLM